MNKKQRSFLNSALISLDVPPNHDGVQYVIDTLCRLFDLDRPTQWIELANAQHDLFDITRDFKHCLCSDLLDTFVRLGD